MKSGFLAAATAALLAFTPSAAFGQNIDSDPASDADCVIALMLLGESAEGDEIEDAIFAMTMYYYGRLGGEGSASASYLASRVGRFVDDETLYLTEAQACANDFEDEAKAFDELAKIFE